MTIDKRQLEEKIDFGKKRIDECTAEIAKRIVGQRDMIDGILMGLLAKGHVLLEGVPGLAKTLALRTTADILELRFKRIQFTPDLLPADIVGTQMFRPQKGEFVPKKGPIFANIILADEINRAPAKVQAALLEAMQERQVTIGDTTYRLENPFFVMATQNPIEHEGTYPLPEAELDRFLLKITCTYPTEKEEVEIVRLVGVERDIEVKKILDGKALVELAETASAVSVDNRITEYIVKIVSSSREKTRDKGRIQRFIEYGASPRASICLYRCAKIRALFDGRSFVLPDDVKSVAHMVLRHRIVLNYEAESEGMEPDSIVSGILGRVGVP
jgi:MoxR-like ATPase